MKHGWLPDPMIAAIGLHRLRWLICLATARITTLFLGWAGSFSRIFTRQP